MSIKKQILRPVQTIFKWTKISDIKSECKLYRL